jgi:hypothetical protein
MDFFRIVDGQGGGICERDERMLAMLQFPHTPISPHDNSAVRRMKNSGYSCGTPQERESMKTVEQRLTDLAGQTP